MCTSLLGLGIAPGNELIAWDDGTAWGKPDRLGKAWTGLDPAPEGRGANSQQLSGLLGAVRLCK